MTGREQDRPRRRAAPDAATAARARRARLSTSDDLAESDRPETRPEGRRAGRVARNRLLSRLTTRRAALLAMVVCALALSIAVPLHTYLAQRADLQDQLRQQEVLREQSAALTQAQQRLSDTAQVEAEARDRFGYVMPGETPYVVQLPGQPPSGSEPDNGQQPPSNASWYEQLWNTVVGNNH